MNDILVQASEVRDLGVIITPDSNFTNHISKVISMVNQRVGYFLRTFSSREPEFIKWIWKNYVQPIIDYSSQLWAPASGGALTRLENTLKSFTSKISGYKHLNYWERLSKLNMKSISRRIERYRILYCYKIIMGKTPNCGIEWNHTNVSGTLISEIGVQSYYKTQRENSFYYVAPWLFNRIPRYLRDIRNLSLNEWKFKLDEFLNKIPDTPISSDTTPGLCEPSNSRPSNSLYHWIPFLGLTSRRAAPDIDDSISSI